MTLDLTQSEINALWDKGFRPFEIYVCNDSPVEYCGQIHPAGAVTGWNIKFVFATRESLSRYPYFDEIIGLDHVGTCDEIFY